MDKKKIIIKSVVLFCVLLIVAVVIFLCIKTRKEEKTVVNKPLNEKVNLAQVFEKLETIEGMERLKTDENINPEELSIEENVELEKDLPDEEEIDFGIYNVLEKKALVNTTDEIVNEVWMIKLGKYEQQEDVCRILGKRLQKLKIGFEGDNYRSTILDKAVIKQEDGIVIMIISPYLEEIEETIAKEMNK